MPRFCSSCGAEMVDTAAFCPKCGRSTGIQSGFQRPPAEPSARTDQDATTPLSPPALQPNIAGLLAYLFIPAIVFLLVEPYRKDPFIRFHSFQAIFLWIVFFIVNAVVSAIPLLNLLLLPFFGLAELVLWVVCMIKAWQEHIFKLPFLGDLSERQAGA